MELLVNHGIRRIVTERRVGINESCFVLARRSMLTQLLPQPTFA